MLATRGGLPAEAGNCGAPSLGCAEGVSGSVFPQIVHSPPAEQNPRPPPAIARTGIVGFLDFPNFHFFLFFFFHFFTFSLFPFFSRSLFLFFKLFSFFLVVRFSFFFLCSVFGRSVGVVFCVCSIWFWVCFELWQNFFLVRFRRA